MLQLVLLIALGVVENVHASRQLSLTPGAVSASSLVCPPQQLRNLREVADALGLSSSNELKIESKFKLPNGLYVAKLRRHYKGLPVRVFTLQAIVDNNGTYNGDIQGYITKLNDIEATENISTKKLKEILVDYINTVNMRSDVEDTCTNELQNFTSTKEVNVDLESGKPSAVYSVSSILTTDVLVRWPRIMVNAKTGDVMKSAILVTRLTSSGVKNDEDIGRCPRLVGGNTKCPGPNYGPGPNEICINASFINGYTVLANKRVEVYTLNNAVNTDQSQIVKFKPGERLPAVNNGSFPGIDAFFYATKALEMFIEWGQLDETLLKDPLKLYVNFAPGFDNALFNGLSIFLGDGNRTFYPVTTLEAIGHEVAHYVATILDIQQYRDETLGPSEALSDISGKSLSAYLSPTGKVKDWNFAFCLLLARNESLRYFYDPPKDNFCIDNLHDYDTLNESAYRAMGILNKAFYCIVKEKGTPIKDAFRAYFLAAQIYLNEATGFIDSACGIYRSANNLGLNTSPFYSCFKERGVNLTFCSVN